MSNKKKKKKKINYKSKFDFFLFQKANIQNKENCFFYFILLNLIDYFRLIYRGIKLSFRCLSMIIRSTKKLKSLKKFENISH